MPYSLSENWDGVSPPSIPAGWNVDAPFVTSSTQYYSTPNSLKLGAVLPTLPYYATNTTVDPNAGALVDMAAYVYLDASASGSGYDAGPTFRCSSSLMDNSTTSCYWVRMHFNPSGSSKLTFTKVVDGTVTDLATLNSGVYPFDAGVWFSIHVVSTVQDYFSVKVVRQSDGWFLNASGDFTSTDGFAIVDFHAPDVSSGDYAGIAASAADDDMVFIDNINTDTSEPVFPRPPVIARIPFQYFITD